MSEWDNYCDEIGGVCKDMEAQDVRIAELCRQISGQLSELLNCPVVCKYDEPENLFYAQIFNVVFDRFDEVESKVSDYSNANYEQLGAFCIPVMFTPEQTRDWFPMYAESNRQGKRIAELEAENERLRKELNLIGTKADFCADECEYGPDATSFRSIADDANRALKRTETWKSGYAKAETSAGK